MPSRGIDVIVDPIGSRGTDPPRQFRISIVEREVRAERPATAEILVAGAGDYARPGRGGQENRGAADVAGTAGDVHRLPGVQALMDGHREMRGRRRMRDGHRLERIDTVRQPVEPLDRNHRVLGGCALAAAVAEAVAPHPLAGGESGGAGTGGGDGSGEVTADDERKGQRGAVGAGAHERVDRVDRDALHADENVGGSVPGHRHLTVPDALPPSELIDPSCPHALGRLGRRSLVHQFDQAPRMIVDEVPRTRPA